MNPQETLNDLDTEAYIYTFSYPEKINKDSLYDLISEICKDLKYEQAPKENFGFIHISRSECIYQLQQYLHNDEPSLEKCEEILKSIQLYKDNEYYVTFKYERKNNSGTNHIVKSGKGYSVINEYCANYCIFIISNKSCRTMLIRWDD